MIKQDSVAGKQPVGLAIIDGDPVGIHFGGAIGTAWIKRRGFALRNFENLPEHFAGGGLVEFWLEPRFPDGLKQANGAQSGDLARVLGNIEADTHMTLRAKVVDFIGLDRAKDAVERAGIVEIAVEEV